MGGEHAFMTFSAQLGCHCSLLQRNFSLPAWDGIAVHLWLLSHAYMPLHCMTQAITHICHAIVRNCIADKKSGLRCFNVSLDNNLSSSACSMAGEHAFMTFPAQLGCHCSLLQRNLSLPAWDGIAVHLWLLSDAYMPLHCMTQAVTHICHAIVRNCIADKKSGLRCFTVSLDNNLSSSACSMAGEHAFMTFPAQLGCHCSLLQRNLSLPAQVGTAVHLWLLSPAYMPRDCMTQAVTHICHAGIA